MNKWYSHNIYYLRNYLKLGETERLLILPLSLILDQEKIPATTEKKRYERSGKVAGGGCSEVRRLSSSELLTPYVLREGCQVIPSVKASLVASS